MEETVPAHKIACHTKWGCTRVVCSAFPLRYIKDGV